jgi:hypothetical protein
MVARTALLAGILTIIVSFPGSTIAAEADGLVAWWRFDDVDTRTIEVHEDSDEERLPKDKPAARDGLTSQDAAESDVDDDDSKDDWVARQAFYVADHVSKTKDRLTGYHKRVPGVSGGALRFGGIGTYVTRANDEVPQFEGSFSSEAWIAIGAYPVHWCSIIGQADETRGALFGIDAHGHVGFRVATNGKWQSLVSKERIALGEWAHIACVYDSSGSLEIYLNGQRVGHAEISGEIEPADDQDLLIAKEPVKRKPLGTIRPHGTKEVHTFFDGLLDEVKLYNQALGADDFARAFEQQRPSQPPQLPERRLPAGPAGPGPFGAFYTTLQYYDAWDAQWRVGEHADVVVRFDNSPCRFVFWRGTSYIPHWVTENGIWYNNEFNETWSEHGCHEPMSDKHCRHAHVRIIESTAARVVVHWRYALVDNWYEFARIDPSSGWGDWTDEVYTIYPDGVGVRQITLHSTKPRAPHEWHEGIIVMGPGQRPEEVLEAGALTMLNLRGKAHTFSWRDGAPDTDGAPPDSNVQIINTKSRFKPFIALLSESEPHFDIYDDELRRDVSMFPWWNHWPTAFDPCDGRYAMDADRASHSSLTHCYWEAHEETANSLTKIMLNGVSDKSPQEIVQIAKSWDAPPDISIKSEGFSEGRYDPAQRAYIARRTGADVDTELSLQLAANDESPVANLAIVIENWNAKDAAVSVNGKPAKFRTGLRTTLNGSDLILWIEHEATQPASIVVTPKQ